MSKFETLDAILQNNKGFIKTSDAEASGISKTYFGQYILAEKLETLFARGTANSRMRDFYDLFVLGDMRTYDPVVLKDAFFQHS